MLIGLLCQFLIMPCIALVAIKTGIFGPYETLIVMLYGTCPGGGISNFFTYYLRLNIDLSGKKYAKMTSRESRVVTKIDRILINEFSYYDKRFCDLIFRYDTTLAASCSESNNRCGNYCSIQRYCDWCRSVTGFTSLDYNRELVSLNISRNDLLI